MFRKRFIPDEIVDISSDEIVYKNEEIVVFNSFSPIISAVNNGDEYELTDLDPALISRFNIYEFCPEVKEWTSWAEKNNIDARVIRYIKSNPKMLDSTNGTTNDYDNLKKSPDRRGWEKVSNIIKSEQNLKEIHFTIISGIVGADAAADFIASQKIAINVSGEAILNNGKNYSRNM